MSLCSRWLMVWIGVALATPVHAGPLGEAEVVLVTTNDFVLVDAAAGREVLALDRGGTVAGTSSVQALRRGDRIRYDAGREKGGVRHTAWLELVPTVDTQPDLRVDVGELVQMLVPGDAASRRGATLIDLRSAEAFSRGHLEGAISAASSKRGFTRLLPPDKDASLILYGCSRQDAQAVEALRSALQLGYRRARIYLGGMREWTEANLPTFIEPSALALRITSEQLAVLDVRPSQDSSRGSLPRSIAVNPPEMQPAEWAGRPLTPRLVIVGRDDADPAPLEVAEKIRRWQPSGASLPPGTILILRGGVAAWTASKGKIAEPRRSIADLPCVPVEGEICPDEFLALWREAKGPGAPLLLDVRGDEQPRPSWAKHVPLGQIADRLAELPRDREIVVFCARGITSQVAQAVLKRAGFRARYVRLPAPPVP